MTIMPKVVALKSHVQDNIKHPLFPHHRFDDTGAAEWPIDQFTMRRIRDGDVALQPAGEKAQQEWGD